MFHKVNETTQDRQPVVGQKIYIPIMSLENTTHSIGDFQLCSSIDFEKMMFDGKDFLLEELGLKIWAGYVYSVTKLYIYCSRNGITYSIPNDGSIKYYFTEIEAFQAAINKVNSINMDSFFHTSSNYDDDDKDITEPSSNAISTPKEPATTDNESWSKLTCTKEEDQCCGDDWDEEESDDINDDRLSQVLAELIKAEEKYGVKISDMPCFKEQTDNNKSFLKLIDNTRDWIISDCAEKVLDMLDKNIDKIISDEKIVENRHEEYRQRILYKVTDMLDFMRDLDEKLHES